MIRTSLFAFGLFTLQACSSSDHPSHDSQGKAALPPGSRDDLTRTLDGVVAGEVAPGVSMSLRHPSYRPWSGASGVANRELGTALTTANRYRAGSIMKMAVATAILQLVERNELALDEDLTELLPAAVSARIPDAPEITLRMLLDHTSGLPEFSTEEFDAGIAEDPTHVYSFDELLEVALAQPMRAPGSGWYYSNTNYILLGRILEQTTGEPWRTTVRERVFARAKLEESELPEPGNSLCNGCSRGYHPLGGELVDLTEVDPSMAGASGGGAFVTTPADLVKLLVSLAEGRLFDDPATLDLMRDFVDAPIPAEAQTGYGLGLQRFAVGDVEFIGHLGGTAGFQGFVLYQPDSAVAVAGYMNRMGDLGAFILPVLEAVSRVE
jgi:D-alanyl-D-alanine carboxypeptidase